MTCTWYIDPGHGKAHAVAVADARGFLIALGWINHRTVQTRHGWIEHLTPDLSPELKEHPPTAAVIERPQYYPGSTTPPNDLIDLAWTAAVNIPACQSITSVLPRVWKGQSKKPPHHHRLWCVLTQAERDLFPRGTFGKIETACQALSLGRKPNYGWKVGDLLDSAALLATHQRRM